MKPCEASALNTAKRTKCGMTYYRNCVMRGKGPYVKVPGNECPHCGAYDSATSA